MGEQRKRTKNAKGSTHELRSVLDGAYARHQVAVLRDQPDLPEPVLRGLTLAHARHVASAVPHGSSVGGQGSGDEENGQTLVLSQPEINAAQARRLWTLIDKRLRERFDITSKMVRMAASELTLRWTGGGQNVDFCGRSGG